MQNKLVNNTSKLTETDEHIKTKQVLKEAEDDPTYYKKQRQLYRDED